MKLVNTTAWDTGTYSEIGQTNLLRWQNLKLVGPDTYEPVSMWWKCKDFMNEVVTSYHLGRDFSIYGFKVVHNKFFNKEDKGIPLRLKGVCPGFLGNMEVVNNYLLEEGYPEVRVVSLGEEMFIHIPEEYLANTLFMSQVTLFIRLANTNKEYATLQEMVKDPINVGDYENFTACLKKPLSKFPPSLGKYIWYYNDQFNCTYDHPKDLNIQTSMMHNCGVVSWGWKEEECVV